MEDSFIDNIRQIILDHLDDEKFGVNQLASEIGLSKSQAFRKIKYLSNKSINQFINETRLEEAAKLILNTDLHASEISYKVGFSSPSYFNKCFSKYFGVTPGEYKEKKVSPPSVLAPLSYPQRIKKFQLLLYILGVSLLIIGALSLIKSNKDHNKVNLEKISVAVLYFDDHSPELDIEWFCSGITEEIISKLSGIKNLMVTSRTSVKQYRNSNQSIPSIAKTLDVDYIIEGSALKYKDSIMITAQLINAKDYHIWSKEYSDRFENIFEIQQTISKDIAQQLKIDLSPEEERKIANIPTVNLEAFKLFTKGVSYADTRTKEDLLKSVELFQKAINLDSNYAAAYAEMAASYRLMYVYNIDKAINYKKINSLLDKSLELDSNTVRAFTTKGMIHISKKNWVKAKENFDKAFELNPNDATLHHYYAIYYDVKPEADYKKALEHINIAYRLNPFSRPINYNKIAYLLLNDKYFEAEDFYNNNSSFFSKILKSKIKNRFNIAYARKIGLEKKDRTETIKFYYKEIEKDTMNAVNYRLLGLAYNEILNDKENYLKNEEKSYTLDSIKSENAHFYYNSLLENKKYKESEELLQNEHFKSLFIEEEALLNLFYWNYYKGNYNKALEILGNYKFENHLEYALGLAKKSKTKETYTILNKGVLKNYEKARVFAILEERDSMYYYINKEKDIYNILKFNSFIEINPYRKEQRFKVFLKKHYLPLTHWNEQGK